MSQFGFLQPEWPSVYEAVGRAEQAVHADPRSACFYARRALELAVAWAFKPLGLVEAKRTRRDPRVGQQQAKLYADCLVDELMAALERVRATALAA